MVKEKIFELINLNLHITEVAIASLRAVAGEHTMQQLLEEREKVGDEIEKFVEKELNRW